MSVDPSVLAAMKAAVESQPDQVGLRLHYAQLLLQSGAAADALGQAQMVLGANPDQLEALRIAADAADATGDAIRAHGYRRLLSALGMDSAKNLIESAGIPEPDLPAEPRRPRSAPVEDDEDEDEDERPRVGLGSAHDGASDEDDDISDMLDAERPDISLEDVKGLKDVKDRLNLAFLGPLRNPDLRKLYGKSLKGGLLLYGPPGCGKTFLARAVAGELGAKFISVGLTDVVDMWLGQSEKNLHKIFDTARRNQPCVLFFDELDAIGRKRSLTREHAGRSIINQLLAEMDGMGSQNEGVFVIAATNHPWDIDSALRRPGRLDRTVLVLPPDNEARVGILESHLDGKPTEALDLKWVANQTEDFSGADVAHIVDSAVEYAMADSIRSGIVRPIKMNDLKQALKSIRPSTRAWFETAKNHAIFANEGGAYDDLLGYLQKKKFI